MSRRIRKTKAGKETPSQPANIRVARNRGLERTSLMQWLAQHRAALRAALSQLGGHRIGSMVNVLVIGLALVIIDGRALKFVGLVPAQSPRP